MKRIADILKSKRGASLIIVMAIMLLLFITGTSIMVASTTTMSTAKAQTDAENVHRYLAEVAREFDKDITATKFSGEDVNDPWYEIARYVYDEKYKDVSKDITIEIKDFRARTSSDFWGSESTADNKTNLNAKITEQLLSQRIAFAPEVKAPILDAEGKPTTDEAGNEILQVLTSEVLEQRDIKIKLEVNFEATYEGKKYNLTAKYNLDGVVERCVGNPKGTCTATDRAECTDAIKNGEFRVGAWKLEGYTKG